MRIGIVSETSGSEQRVPAYPGAVEALAGAGHEVFVMAGAGGGAHFQDEEYEAAGARVVHSAEGVYRRSDLVLRIEKPPPEELVFLDEKRIVMAFFHLRTATAQYLDALLASGATVVGYEFITDDGGLRPILASVSEIAGQLAVQAGAYYLLSSSGGRGHVLGGAPGVPPCNVVIVGASNAGLAAARCALGAGATVTLLDTDVGRLKSAREHLDRRAITTFANPSTLPRAVGYADLLIGAMRRLDRDPTEPEILVTEEMVKGMKPFSVIVDLSLGYGGCIETSRPTSLASPTYVLHDVIHHCVPNLTSKAGRSASYAVGNALLPYVLEIGRGPENYFERSPALARGTYVRGGGIVHAGLARAFGRELAPLGEG